MIVSGGAPVVVERARPWWRALEGWRSFSHDLRTALLQHRVKDLSAQLAFWALLAVFPFSIFVLTVVGYVPLHGVDQQLMSLVYSVMPEQAAVLVDHTVHEVVGRQRGWLLLVSLVGWGWSASGGMGSVAQALNLAWGVGESRAWWRRRALAIGMTIGAAGLVVVGTVTLLVGPNLVKKGVMWLGLAGHLPRVWAWVRFPMAIADILFMLACLYHFLPDRRQPFRIFTPGAVVAVAGWIAMSLVFNSYVAHFHAYAKTYGALGGAVILLMWLYLSSLMVILGGEINAAWDRARQRPATSTGQPQPS